MLSTLKTFAAHRPSFAIGLVFAINSVLFGSWVTRIPEVQANLAITKTELGVALLMIAIGALVTMPFMAWVMAKLTIGRTVFLTTIACCIFMTLPLAMPTYAGLMVALFFAGMANGSMDVAMNAAAASIEQTHDKVIMSTCHGMFSLGGMIGAVLGSLLAGFGVSPSLHLLVMGSLMLGLTLYLQPTLYNVPHIASEEEQLFVLPRGSLIILAIIGFGIMIGEGAVADWSAVYLSTVLKGSPFVAGLGFAGFSLTMAIGRFYGDNLIPKIGAVVMIRWGSLIGALGLLLVIMIPTVVTAILGFTLVGLGFSCVVPILFSAAAKVPNVPMGIGVAGVTTAGILGFLIGPPLIGFIADSFGLANGFGFILILALIAALLASYMPKSA